MQRVHKILVVLILALFTAGACRTRGFAQQLYVSGEDYGVAQIDYANCGQTLFTGVGNIIKGEGVKFGPDGNLYVCDNRANSVLKFDGTTGASLGTFVSDPNLNGPTGLAFGPDNNLYISSSLGSAVLRYSGTTGAFMNFFVVGGGTRFLNNPAGLTFGPDGNLYVTSRGNSSVFRYNGTTSACAKPRAERPIRIVRQRPSSVARGRGFRSGRIFVRFRLRQDRY